MQVMLGWQEFYSTLVRESTPTPMNLKRARLHWHAIKVGVMDLCLGKTLCRQEFSGHTL